MIPEDLTSVWSLYQESEAENFAGSFYKTVQEAVAAFPSYRNYMYDLCDMGFWVVCKSDTGEIIGRVGFEPKMTDDPNAGFIEMGYMIGKANQGKGYALEACEIAIEAARKLEIEKLYCKIHNANQNSLCLAKKLGFRKEEIGWKLQKEQSLPDHGWYVCLL